MPGVADLNCKDGTVSNQPRPRPGGWRHAAQQFSQHFARSLTDRARGGLDAVRQRRLQATHLPPRGVAFAGTVWTGGNAEPRPGIVVVDSSGRVAAVADSEHPLGHELLVLGGEHHWVVPGIVDAHVHLAFDPASSSADIRGAVSGFNTGLIGVRDLGAPLRQAMMWQTGRRAAPANEPFVAVSGPILTAPDGYPSRSWGADGYAEFVGSTSEARSAVQHLAAAGVDVIKVALEPGTAGWPVLQPDVLLAACEAAHSLGLGVVAHALTAAMVTRALDAGVDELAHTPTERLPQQLVDRIANAGVSVTSTLQTFFSGGVGPDAAANAADLVAAGVTMRYGTDLGNAGTAPGVDPRELDRLAAAGLGRLGALRAATEHSARALGMRTRSGRIMMGEAAGLVLLPSDPLAEPGVWRTPAAVFADGRLTVGVALAGRRL